ncbi:MAG: hypothetical protein JWM28_2311 [Chitinophagaceae bacterium]|nr:hypothetical protein [Chitinophagaceae bacterium]
MAKNFVSISRARFAKLHARLKKLEQGDNVPKIGGMRLSSFLVADAALADDKSDPKPIRTKRIVLLIAGDFTTKPENLSGSLKLKTNLGYQADEYVLLQIRLDKLVKEYIPTASVSSAEATACEKVSDCVTLVNKKTTIPV